MIPQRVIIYNYKSYEGKHVFEFPGAGLHYVTGRNLSKKRMGANGAGKTSLFDALYWCWYGTTIKGRRGRDLVNWYAEDDKTFVVYEYLSGKTLHRLKRRWSAGTLALTLDDKVVEQDKVDEALGVNAELAKHTRVIPQAQNAMFMDLTPSRKQDVFSNLLNLDVWLDCSKEAKLRYNDLVAQLEKLQMEIDGVRSQVHAAEDRLHNYRRLLKEERANKDSADQELRRRLREAKAELVKVEENLAEGISSNKKVKQRNESLMADVDRARQKLRDVHNDRVRLLEELSGCKAIYEQRDQQVRRIADLLDNGKGRCFLCGQDVDADHLKGEFKEAMRRRKIRERKLDELYNRKEEFADRVKRAEAAVDTVEHDLTKTATALAEWRAQSRSYQQQRDTLNGICDDLRKQRTDLTNQKSANETLIEAAQKELDDLHASLDAHKRKRRQLREESGLAHYWIKGFRTIRLQLMDYALQELTLESNNALTELGLTGWSLEFVMEKETKSGKTAYGFQCFVRKPGLKRDVPWDLWSGGESQRIRLAGTMGLASVVSSHAGISVPFEIWDEPTQYLSEPGIQDLCDCLAERARVSGKQIWFIDHRSIDFGGFSSTTTIVHDRNGSRIEAGHA